MGRGGAGSEEHDEEEWNEVGRLLLRLQGIQLFIGQQRGALQALPVRPAHPARRWGPLRGLGRAPRSPDHTRSSCTCAPARARPALHCRRRHRPPRLPTRCTLVCCLAQEDEDVSEQLSDEEDEDEEEDVGRHRKKAEKAKPAKASGGKKKRSGFIDDAAEEVRASRLCGWQQPVNQQGCTRVSKLLRIVELKFMRELLWHRRDGLILVLAAARCCPCGLGKSHCSCCCGSAG